MLLKTTWAAPGGAAQNAHSPTPARVWVLVNHVLSVLLPHLVLRRIAALFAEFEHLLALLRTGGFPVPLSPTPNRPEPPRQRPTRKNTPSATNPESGHPTPANLPGRPAFRPAIGPAPRHRPPTHRGNPPRPRPQSQPSSTLSLARIPHTHPTTHSKILGNSSPKLRHVHVIANS